MPAMYRIQISIGREQLDRVRDVAVARGSSVAAVIRDAIDVALPDDPVAERAAARRFAADALLVAHGGATLELEHALDRS